MRPVCTRWYATVREDFDRKFDSVLTEKLGREGDTLGSTSSLVVVSNRSNMKRKNDVLIDNSENEQYMRGITRIKGPPGVKKRLKTLFTRGNRHLPCQRGTNNRELKVGCGVI